jgi:hypothetical protein
MTIVQQPEVASERVAVIVYLLGKGHRFRTADIAEYCGVTRRGAYAMMARISRVVPLAQANDEWFFVGFGKKLDV